MTEVVTKRLFIGGLASRVSKDELIEKFSVFGKVDNVKLTTRLDEKGVLVVTFAHLDLKGEEAKLKNCFTLYQNSKWKGSVLKLEHAKESFLDKLQKEREESNLPQESAPPPVAQRPPDISDIKGPAVPGTPIPGNTDWVVGKYGRVLPVLTLKKYRSKMVRIDPSKLCHAARVFKEDSATNGSCDTLTWEISTPDSDITKKRKGEFPASQKEKKLKETNYVQPTSATSFDGSDSLRAKVASKKDTQFEIVKQGVDILEIVKPGYSQAGSAQRNANKSNIFDSDIESDAEAKAAAAEPKKNQPKSSTKKCAADAKANQKNGRSSEGLSKQSVEGAKRSFDSDNRNDAATKPASAEPKKNQIKSSATPKTAIDNQNKIKPLNLAESFQGRRGAVKIPVFKGLTMLGDESDREEPPLTKVAFSPKNSLPGGEEKTSPIVQKVPDKEVQRKSAKKEKNSKHKLSSLDETSTDVLSKFNNSAASKTTSPANADDSQSKRSAKTFSGSSEKKSISTVSMKDSDARKEDGGNESASSADTDEIIAKHKKKLNLSQSNAGQPGGNNKTTALSKSGITSAAPRSLDSSLSDYSFHTSEYSFDTTGLSDYSLPNVSVVSVSQDDSDLDSNDFELVAKKLAHKAALSSGACAPDHVPAQRKLTPKVNKDAKATHESVQSLLTTKVNQLSKTTHESVSDNSSNKKQLTTRMGEPDDKSGLKQDLMDKDKKTSANEKRLQALKETSKLKQRQQSLIQKALKNVDSKDFSSANRKVFASDSEEEEAADKDHGALKENSVMKSQKNSQKTGLNLFDGSSDSDSESDYDEMFKSKPHFEGKKGEQLMKMERKFGDSRFKLDSKFVDSDSEDEVADKTDAGETINKDAALEEEKAASLKVLENVIGKTNLDRFSEKLKRNTKHLIDMNTVRFDPTKLSQQKEVNAKQDEKQLPTKRVSSEKESKDKGDPEVDISGASKSHEKKKKQLASLNEEKLANSKPADDDKPAKDKKNKVSQAPAAGDNKKSLEPMDTSENLEHLRKTRVQMDKSLVNLFKGEKEKGPVFSLLKQFDDEDSGSGDSCNESDMETLESKDTKSKGVLSGLLKSTKVVEPATTKTAKVSNIKKSEALNGQNNKVETRRFINEVDDEDISEDDSLPDPDDTLLKNPDVETDKEMLNAGRIDIRYTKDLWHQRWEEIRPNLVKIFKRKHRDALKSKRVDKERKRKQDFVKNAKNKHWRQQRRR